jgi:hypothetical protein
MRNVQALFGNASHVQQYYIRRRRQFRQQFGDQPQGIGNAIEIFPHFFVVVVGSITNPFLVTAIALGLEETGFQTDELFPNANPLFVAGRPIIDHDCHGLRLGPLYDIINHLHPIPTRPRSASEPIQFFRAQYQIIISMLSISIGNLQNGRFQCGSKLRIVGFVIDKSRQLFPDGDFGSGHHRPSPLLKG